MRARAMELNIPAIHGVGESLIYFVDRYDEFSIYDIDFRAIPTVDPHPPAIGGMHFFGLVQYIGADRTADWVEFYSQIFGFAPLPDTRALRHHAQGPAAARARAASSSCS